MITVNLSYFDHFDLFAISSSDCKTSLLFTLSELAQCTVLTQHKLCHHYACSEGVKSLKLIIYKLSQTRVYAYKEDRVDS